MKTFIKFFENDEKEFEKNYKHSGLTITVSGLTCSGKTTGARAIAEYFGLEYHSSGSIFREIAKRKGIPLEEFVKIRSNEIDIEADRQTLKLAIIGNVVLDGRLTGWVAGRWANVKIFYDVPFEIRVKRYAEREGVDVNTAIKSVKEIDEANEKKYKSLYGIDLSDLSIYDIIIDNSNCSLEESKKKSIEIIEKFLEKRK
jgi:cytidylate kinase